MVVALLSLLDVWVCLGVFESDERGEVRFVALPDSPAVRAIHPVLHAIIALTLCHHRCFAIEP